MVTIRQERPVDERAREALLDRAYGNERHGKPSAKLRNGRLPAEGLALVAVERGRVVGTVRLWHVQAGGQAALLLGPLAVDPAEQRRGIGAVLMRRAIEVARRSWPRGRAAGGRRRLLQPIRLFRRKDRRAEPVAQGRSCAPARARTQAGRARPIPVAGSRRLAGASRSRCRRSDGVRGSFRARHKSRQKPSTTPREIRAGLFRCVETDATPIGVWRSEWRIGRFTVKSPDRS